MKYLILILALILCGCGADENGSLYTYRVTLYDQTGEILRWRTNEITYYEGAAQINTTIDIPDNSYIIIREN